MQNFPKRLAVKLSDRTKSGSLRALRQSGSLIDFSSNDYLGFARCVEIYQTAHSLVEQNGISNGATGSRLISGNYDLYTEAESLTATFHGAESALIFNSGYDANLGFFSSVPQRNDIVLYDEYCHASIRDGIRLSGAKSIKFAHNDLHDLQRRLEKFNSDGNEIFVATESVFSMDGDSPDLLQLVELCTKYGARLVIDEAHAVGVFGKKGEGLIAANKLQDRIFATIVTFGKALGCHGAAVLGSADLRDYLINFARSFIYSTALPPHAVATVIAAGQHLQNADSDRHKLTQNIRFFDFCATKYGISDKIIVGNSAIKCVVIPGNETVQKISRQFIDRNFDIRAILSPTVPIGQERLRICIHSYNSQAEIEEVLRLLATFVKQE